MTAGTVFVNGIRVGDSLPIGLFEFPYAGNTSIITINEIIGVSKYVQETLNWTSWDRQNEYDLSKSLKLCIRPLVSISVTNDSGVNLSFYAHNKNLNGTFTSILISTISNGSAFIYETTPLYSYYSFIPQTPSTSSITLTLNATAFNQ
jgi:hypothetical protein